MLSVHSKNKDISYDVYCSSFLILVFGILAFIVKDDSEQTDRRP